MQHNVTHCSSNGCIKRDTCYRYLAHLDARKQELTWLPYLNPAVCQEENYNMYWRVDESS